MSDQPSPESFESTESDGFGSSGSPDAVGSSGSALAGSSNIGDLVDRSDAPSRIGEGATVIERPLRIAVVNDYEVIVRGVASMLRPYADQVRVVETEVGGMPTELADIALFDTFGGQRSIVSRARETVADIGIGHVVLYTWSADADLLAIARASGLSGVLSKAASAAELVNGLERIANGDRVGLDSPLRLANHGPQSPHAAGVVPANLTPREQEVLAMLGLGLSNRDIAEELFLGVETVRTYVRQVYQKLGVKNRTQAAVRARVLGLEPAAERRPAS